MDFMEPIERFVPSNEQEGADKAVLLSFAKANRDTVLLRENAVAHITSSGFLMNRQLDKVLLVHHNIRKAWAWTGGHADGEPDLLQVAVKEAKEETGVITIYPFSQDVASLDILPVRAHERKGRYVNAHLHLSVAYILICREEERTRPALSENTDVAWFDVSHFTEEHFDAADVYLYQKLIQRARSFRG